jgi:hypothetical protein
MALGMDWWGLTVSPAATTTVSTPMKEKEALMKALRKAKKWPIEPEMPL